MKAQVTFGFHLEVTLMTANMDSELEYNVANQIQEFFWGGGFTFKWFIQDACRFCNRLELFKRFFGGYKLPWGSAGGSRRLLPWSACARVAACSTKKKWLIFRFSRLSAGAHFLDFARFAVCAWLSRNSSSSWDSQRMRKTCLDVAASVILEERRSYFSSRLTHSVVFVYIAAIYPHCFIPPFLIPSLSQLPGTTSLALPISPLLCGTLKAAFQRADSPV